MNVLFVDDDEVTLFLYQMLVKNFPGMQPFYAKDGQEAINLLKSGQAIDVVFTDLNMPVLDGFALLSEHDRLPIHQQAQGIFVMLGTSISDDKKSQVLQYASVKDALPKPLTVDLFKQACLQIAG